MNKIARNYLYNAAYQILVLIAPVITAPYLARVLGASSLGIYSYVNSSGNIVTTLSLLGIYAYGNRQVAYVRESKDSLTQTFWEILAVRIGLGALGTIVYAIYAELNPEYSFFFWIYYPYILAQFIDCSWVYVGLEDMRPAVMKNFVTKLANIAGIFLLVKDKDDLWIYILLLAVTALAANISIYTQLPKYIGKPTRKISSLSRHLKGSLALFLPQVASLIYLQVDKVMLEWLTGATNEVSFYDQAEKIITIPLSLITVISTVVMPRLANEYQNGNQSGIQALLLQAGRYALCMAMPMMLGLFCIARQFVPWYLGEEFYAAANAMMVLTPIILLNTLTGISGKQYFTATNQTSILLKAYVAAALMNVVINALLIPKYGHIGAAIATVLSSLASAAIQYRYLIFQIDTAPLWRYLGKYFLGAVLMAAVITALCFNMPASPVTTIIQICLGISIYSVYLIVTKDAVLKEIVAIILKKRAQRRG